MIRLTGFASEAEDAAYAAAVGRVQHATLEDLGAHRRYWGCDFAAAAEALQQVGHAVGPAQKAQCVVRSQAEILASCNDTGAPLGADDLLPLLTYVAAQAQVPHLASQVRYAIDFLAEGLCQGELGYYLTCMHAVVATICQHTASAHEGPVLSAVASGGAA